MKIDLNTSLKNNNYENSLTKMILNLFKKEICVDCKEPCHCGSDRFINRYPVYSDDVEGWRCGDCATEIDSILEELNEN